MNIQIANRIPSRLLAATIAFLALLTTVMAVPASAAAPNDPTGVAAAAGSNGVTVSWTLATPNGDPVTGYEVTLVGGPSAGAFTAGPGDTSHNFPDLLAGTYSATVMATSDGGDSGAASSGGPAVIIGVPDAPSAVSVSASGLDGVQVSWSPGSENGSVTTGFTVLLVGSNGGVAPGANNEGPGASSSTFTGLTPGDYSATVVASSAAGSSGSSASAAPNVTIVGSPVVPSTPNVSMSPGETTMGVTWTVNNNLGVGSGSTFTNYVVTLNPGGHSTTITVASNMSHTFTGLNPSTPYTASVTATNSTGSSGAGTANASTTTAASVPDSPTGVSASLSGNTINVAFVAPANNGGASITSYRVQLFKGATLIQTQNPSNTAGVSFVVADSGDYTVQVAARNAVGLSVPVSAPANNGVLEVRISPSKPRNVVLSSNGDQVTVDWQAPVTDGGLILKYRVTFGGNTTEVNHPATSTVISGVGPGNYSASVVAVNTFNLSSASQASNNSVNVIVAPDAPTNVVATAEVQTVTVTWEPPTSTGGSTVLSYKITLAGVSKTVSASTRQVVFNNVQLGSHFATIGATTSAGAGATASSNTILAERAFHPFNEPGNFVDQLYSDILGRRADPGGHSFWTAQLNESEARVPLLVNKFLVSAEFGPRRPIIRLYLAYFNRAPDKGGFDYWTGLYASGGISLRDASFNFSASEEFSNTYGDLSNGQFVVLVYNNVLGRTPDIGGFNYWVNLLSSGVSRADVMLAFSEGLEFRASSKDFADITMVYRGMMDRIPNVGDANNEYTVWLPRLRGSEDIDDLILDVFNSQEYEDRITP